MEKLNHPIPENVPSKEELLAEKVINISPELKNWAISGYQHGYFKLEHLSDEKHLRKERKLFKTSRHETAHEKAVRFYNWNLQVISIIQQGNTLGYVEAIPPANRPQKQVLLEKMVICYAGMAGEESMDDHDHRGCGSDFGQATFIAEVLSKYTQEYHGQFYSLIDWAKSKARSIVDKEDEDQLDRETFDLMRVGRR